MLVTICGKYNLRCEFLTEPHHLEQLKHCLKPFNIKIGNNFCHLWDTGKASTVVFFPDGEVLGALYCKPFGSFQAGVMQYYPEYLVYTEHVPNKKWFKAGDCAAVSLSSYIKAMLQNHEKLLKKLRTEEIRQIDV